VQAVLLHRKGPEVGKQTSADSRLFRRESRVLSSEKWFIHPKGETRLSNMRQGDT